MVLQSRCLELCAALEAAESTWSKQEAEVKELRSRCWEADSLLASAYEDEQRAAAREAALEEEKRLTTVRCLVLEEEKRGMAARQRVIEDEACALREQVERLDEARRHLEGHCAGLEAALSVADTSRQARLSETEEQRRAGLEDSIAASQEQQVLVSRCEQLSAELAEAQGRCEGLQGELAAVQEAAEAERGALQSMIDSAMASAEGCRSELEATKEGNVGLELQVQELEDSLRRTERQLEESLRQSEALEAAQSLMRAESDGLQDSVEMALAAKEVSASSLSAAQQRVSELIRSTEEIERHASLQAEANASLLRGYASLLQALEAKQEVVASEASKALSELARNLDALKSENEQLRKQNCATAAVASESPRNADLATRSAVEADDGLLSGSHQAAELRGASEAVADGKSPSSPSRESSPHRLFDIGYEQVAMGSESKARAGGVDEGCEPCADCVRIQAQLEASQVMMMQSLARIAQTVCI